MIELLDPSTVLQDQAAQATWNKIAASSYQADPFCCRTEWQLSYVETMSPNRKVLIHEEGGSQLTFALNRFRGRRNLLTPLETTWLFGSPLLGEHSMDLLADRLPEILSMENESGPINGLIISAIPNEGELRNQLIKQLGPHARLRAVREEGVCAASLSGGLDGYLSRRSPSFRKGIRKQSSKASREGVTFERQSPQTVQAAEDVYQRMIDVELKSWKGIGECGMAEDNISPYYACMINRLALGGNARVIFARHEGTDIGYIFGGLGSDCYRGQQFSFDDKWKKYSIGNLMQLEKIRWLCEDNIARYEMGPTMAYKSHWTEEVVSIHACLVEPTIQRRVNP
jgi:hypothetical protein